MDLRYDVHKIQILGAVSCSQVAMAFGAQVAVAGVIIPKLEKEEDPRLRMTLVEASWIRMNNMFLIFDFDLQCDRSYSNFHDDWIHNQLHAQWSSVSQTWSKEKLHRGNTVGLGCCCHGSICW